MVPVHVLVLFIVSSRRMTRHNFRIFRYQYCTGTEGLGRIVEWIGIGQTPRAWKVISDLWIFQTNECAVILGMKKNACPKLLIRAGRLQYSARLQIYSHSSSHSGGPQTPSHSQSFSVGQRCWLHSSHLIISVLEWGWLLPRKAVIWR